MFTTPNMGLKIWNLATDLFSHTELEGNFAELDVHDHTNGNGVQIPTGGIANGAITTSKIAAGATLTVLANTFAAIPSPTAPGQLYLATDRGVFYFATGSAWNALLIAGPWTNLTLGGAMSNLGTPPAGVRQEGDLIRFRGSLRNSTGSAVTVGTSLGTLPSLAIPIAGVPTMSAVANVSGSGAAMSLSVSLSGVLTATQSIANTATVGLDGLTYSLNE